MQQYKRLNTGEREEISRGLATQKNNFRKLFFQNLSTVVKKISHKFSTRAIIHAGSTY